MVKPKVHERLVRSRPKIITDPDAIEQTTVKLPVIKSILTAACIAVAAWFSYKGYLETRVNTPYNVEKVLKLVLLHLRNSSNQQRI